MAGSVVKVRFYRNGDGEEPVRDWLVTLGPEARKAMGEDIKAIELGWPLGMPLVRKMEPGLWEIRSRLPSGIVRIFFTMVAGTMVLLHGFVKKSEKTPSSDLKIAQARKQEVQNAR